MLGLTVALASCGSDVVLPPESQPAAIAVLSGDKQSALAGAPLGQPLVVRVTAADGRPVEGQAVAFTIDAGGGAVTLAPQTGGVSRCTPRRRPAVCLAGGWAS